jgi:hypothetical protein
MDRGAGDAWPSSQRADVPAVTGERCFIGEEEVVTAPTKATTSEIVAIVLAVIISIFALLKAGATAVWLTSEVIAFALVILSTEIVAGCWSCTSAGGRHCVTESWPP